MMMETKKIQRRQPFKFGKTKSENEKTIKNLAEREVIQQVLEEKKTSEKKQQQQLEQMQHLQKQ